MTRLVVEFYARPRRRNQPTSKGNCKSPSGPIAPSPVPCSKPRPQLTLPHKMQLVGHLHKPCRRSPRIRKRRIAFAAFSFCACFSARSQVVQACGASTRTGWWRR
jgi:hypothetical protein